MEISQADPKLTTLTGKLLLYRLPVLELLGARLLLRWRVLHELGVGRREGGSRRRHLLSGSELRLGALRLHVFDQAVRRRLQEADKLLHLLVL
jgi:hypothetical protein